MKKTILLLWLGGIMMVAARESNLINNSGFARGLLHWTYEGKGECRLFRKKPVFTKGVLYHYFDLGNLEHSDPECAKPANRVFRFRIAASGEGNLRLGVRARIMTAGNAMEFKTHWSPVMKLGDKLRNFDFEGMESNPDTVFHDKLLIETDGKIRVADTSFYYLDRNAFEIRFVPECAVVHPGENLKVAVHTSVPNQKLTVDLYCGQTIPGGYDRSVRSFITTDAKGRAKIAFQVPYAVTDGVRLAVSDPVTGVKKSFFGMLLTDAYIMRLRKAAEKLSGKKHILFLGDSLTDYDRGRNYPSLISCFLPAGWTLRNAGVGGDDLRKIYARLTGQKVHRAEMYDQLFSPMPDIIFLLCGGNDTKVSFRSGYQKNETPEEIQSGLLDNILSELKKRAPKARIVLISPLDSYEPSQKALAEPMVKAKVNHNYFGAPVHISRFADKMKRAAAKHGTGFCCATEIFRAAEDKQQLHVPDDGVHLSLKGHQLMAEIVLNYLAGMESK